MRDEERPRAAKRALARVIHRSTCDLVAIEEEPCYWDERDASMLYERGVRLLTVDTLVRAIHKTTGYPIGDETSVVRKWATELLEAIG